jgi:hypothetical protein
MIPYKKTESYRATLVQEARVFVPPDPDAPAGSYRCVQVLIPDSPKVSVAIDKDPKDLGLNREYKMPVWSPGAQITIRLLPDQWLIGASNISFAEVSVIVEYLMGVP